MMWAKQFLNRFSSPVIFALVITSVFALTTSITAFVVVNVQSQELTDRLYRDTQYLAESLVSLFENGGVEALKQQLEVQAHFDTEGTVLASYWDGAGQFQLGNLRVQTPFVGRRALLLGEDLPSLVEVQDENEGFYFGFGVKVDHGWILVARDSRWVSDTQELLEQSILWGLGIAMLAIALVVFAIARLTSTRVQSINSVLSRASAGDLSARCPTGPSDKDELGNVSRRINHTLDSLQRSMESLRQVSADIAHDLRRPLTRLRLKLERCVSDLDDSVRLEETLGSALEDLDNLASTFDAILRLAQIESGAQVIELRPVNLVELSQEVYELFEPVAEDSQHRLEISVPQSLVTVPGDLNLLRQAVINLVDNALNYTPAHSTIRLTLMNSAEGPSLTISDNGPGIPDEEFDKVILRFYRTDKSRHVEGTGLGLSLVSAIAARHDAQLILSNNRPGLSARLLFPGLIK